MVYFQPPHSGRVAISIVVLCSVEDMEKQTSTKELIALVEGARKVLCRSEWGTHGALLRCIWSSLVCMQVENSYSQRWIWLQHISPCFRYHRVLPPRIILTRFVIFGLNHTHARIHVMWLLCSVLRNVARSDCCKAATTWRSTMWCLLSAKNVFALEIWTSAWSRLSKSGLFCLCSCVQAKATPLHLPALTLKPHYEYWKVRRHAESNAPTDFSSDCQRVRSCTVFHRWLPHAPFCKCRRTTWMRWVSRDTWLSHPTSISTTSIHLRG